MFVWPHKLILKTCGTTTLLLGLASLLSIAKKTCGFQGVWRCFYSRKTFMFPERQLGPHKKWSEEVEFLDGIFGAFGDLHLKMRLPVALLKDPFQIHRERFRVHGRQDERRPLAAVHHRSPLRRPTSPIHSIPFLLRRVAAALEAQTEIDRLFLGGPTPTQILARIADGLQSTSATAPSSFVPF